MKNLKIQINKTKIEQVHNIRLCFPIQNTKIPILKHLKSKFLQ